MNESPCDEVFIVEVLCPQKGFWVDEFRKLHEPREQKDAIKR
jgi:hypothetical protein